MTNVHHLQTSSTSTDALPLSWIEALFDRMSLSYGRKFAEQWDGVDPQKLKAHWARELASMTREELSRGYAALETRDWPPTLPEFKKLCRPGIDVDAAIAEAIEQLQRRNSGTDTWSHPAIFWTALKVGYHEMTTMTHAQIKTRFAPILSDLLGKGSVEPVPQRRVAIAAPVATPMPPEQVAEAKQQAQATIKRTEDKIDHRAWAKKILKRKKRGDASLTLLQVRFAQEAMTAPDA